MGAEGAMTRNHQRPDDLAYRGGQAPIVHLELDMNGVIEWANGEGRRWAFALSNAGVGVLSADVKQRLEAALADIAEPPPVLVRTDWHF
jgi:hypothetical protein